MVSSAYCAHAPSARRWRQAWLSSLRLNAGSIRRACANDAAAGFYAHAPATSSTGSPLERMHLGISPQPDPAWQDFRGGTVPTSVYDVQPTPPGLDKLRGSLGLDKQRRNFFESCRHEPKAATPIKHTMPAEERFAVPTLTRYSPPLRAGAMLERASTRPWAYRAVTARTCQWDGLFSAATRSPQDRTPEHPTRVYSHSVEATWASTRRVHEDCGRTVPRSRVLRSALGHAHNALVGRGRARASPAHGRPKSPEVPGHLSRRRLFDELCTPAGRRK